MEHHERKLKSVYYWTSIIGCRKCEELVKPIRDTRSAAAGAGRFRVPEYVAARDSLVFGPKIETRNT